MEPRIGELVTGWKAQAELSKIMSTMFTQNNEHGESLFKRLKNDLEEMEQQANYCLKSSNCSKEDLIEIERLANTIEELKLMEPQEMISCIAKGRLKWIVSRIKFE